MAVLPPLVDKGVSNLTGRVVMSAFSEYLSAPDSGYEVYDREHTDKLVGELGEQRGGMYSDSTARDMGKRAGVQHVCISQLSKEGDEFLVECKVIDVETGKARTTSEFAKGGNDEVRRASVAVIKKLLGKYEEPRAQAQVQAQVQAPARPAPQTTASAGAEAEEQYQTGLKCSSARDYDEAAKWFRKAADQGNEHAKKALKRLGY